MPAVPGRTPRKRGAQSLVPMTTRVPEATRLAANHAAQELGVSLGIYLEDLIARDQQVRSGRSTTAGGSTAA